LFSSGKKVRHLHSGPFCAVALQKAAWAAAVPAQLDGFDSVITASDNKNALVVNALSAMFDQAAKSW
jgi:hypothetical protein